MRFLRPHIQAVVMAILLLRFEGSSHAQILSPTRTANYGGHAWSFPPYYHNESRTNQSFSDSFSDLFFITETDTFVTTSVAVACSTLNDEINTSFNGGILLTETDCGSPPQGMGDPRPVVFVEDFVNFSIENNSYIIHVENRGYASLSSPVDLQSHITRIIHRPGFPGGFFGTQYGSTFGHPVWQQDGYELVNDAQGWFRVGMRAGSYSYYGSHSGDMMDRPNCPPFSSELSVGGQSSLRIVAPCTTVIQQPTPVTFCPGDSVTLSFNVSGSESLSWQWFKKTRRAGNSRSQDVQLRDGLTDYGAMIAGSNTSQLTIENAQGQDVDIYWCYVSSPFGLCTTVASNDASVELADYCCYNDVNSRGTFLRTDDQNSAELPTIISLAQCGVLCDEPVRLSQLGVYLSGDGQSHEAMVGVFSTSNVVLPYDQLNRIPGAISASQVTGVQTPPTPNGQPTNISQDFLVGPNDTLTIPCGAQYLILSPLTNSFSGNHDPAPPARRWGVIFYICGRPRVVEQPSDAAACIGDTVQFEATARNWRPYFVQWRKNGVNLQNQPGHILGAVGTSQGSPVRLTILNASAADQGTYDCEIRNCRTATTDPAVLTIVNTPPVVTQQTTRPFPFAGAHVEFEVAATGAASYRWRRNGDPLTNFDRFTNTDQPRLIIDSVLTGDGGLYDCVITNSCGSTISNAEPLRFRGMTLPGDVNNDCQVDLSDLVLLLANFGVGGFGDMDSDGDTDLGDLTALLGGFGSSCQ